MTQVRFLSVFTCAPGSAAVMIDLFQVSENKYLLLLLRRNMILYPVSRMGVLE